MYNARLFPYGAESDRFILQKLWIKPANDLFIPGTSIKSVHEPHLLVILNSTRRKKNMFSD